MFVTLDESCDDGAVDTFVRNLQKILQIPPDTGLKQYHIERGSTSLTLTFQLSCFIVRNKFPLSEEQEMELSNNGISNLWFIYQFKRHQKQVAKNVNFLIFIIIT